MMRSSVVANTARAIRRIPLGARQPFVCAACRSASARHAPLIARASFTSSQTRHQDSQPSARTTQKETVLPQTFYDMFPETFPNGPPPNSSFSPDLRRLRKEFLQLQGKAHPDLASSDKKRQAEALSSRINEAYKTLSDPLKRAQYLLSLQGIDVEDESAKLGESELLMEVMEAREEVEEVEDEQGLEPLREANNERIQSSVDRLDELFGESDWEAAAHEAVRLRYWKNIEESIQGWEKGQGGGMIHH